MEKVLSELTEKRGAPNLYMDSITLSDLRWGGGQAVLV